jgi:hypothetical protein
LHYAVREKEERFTTKAQRTRREEAHHGGAETRRNFKGKMQATSAKNTEKRCARDKAAIRLWHEPPIVVLLSFLSVFICVHLWFIGFFFLRGPGTAFQRGRIHHEGAKTPREDSQGGQGGQGEKILATKDTKDTKGRPRAKDNFEC